MRNIEDIPEIPDQDARMAEITTDAYGREEELSAFDVYLTEALHPPFAALWRDPDEPGHEESVTVLGMADIDDRRGILLNVRRQRTHKERRVVAEQVWARDAASRNAIVLDDYRMWVKRGGLNY
jgi:Calcium binding